MLIGRQKELEKLEALYEENSFRILWIAGEEGTGKTALVRDFIKRKIAFWYTVQQVPPSMNCRLFKETMIFQDEKIKEGGLSELVRLSRHESVVLVIDDAENIDNSFPDILKELANIVTDPSNIRLLVIFCSTTLDVPGWLEKKVTESVIERMDLKRLSYIESIPFYKGFELEEKLLLYGITYGKTRNLALIQNDKSLRENIYMLFYSPNAPFRYEGDKRLAIYFREPQVYHAILAAIASGVCHMQNISEQVGMEANKLSRYTASLVQQGLLRREILSNKRMEGHQQKKTFYRIPDSSLLFWYRFVFPYTGTIDRGLGNKILRDSVLLRLDEYMRYIFISVCAQFTLQLRGRWIFNFDKTKLGFYWTGAFAMDHSLLMAVDKKRMCIAKCFWTKRKIDVSDIKACMAFSLPGDWKEIEFLIYSRKGFTDRALAYSTAWPNLRLISLVYIK